MAADESIEQQAQAAIDRLENRLTALQEAGVEVMPLLDQLIHANTLYRNGFPELAGNLCGDLLALATRMAEGRETDQSAAARAQRLAMAYAMPEGDPAFASITAHYRKVDVENPPLDDEESAQPSAASAIANNDTSALVHDGGTGRQLATPSAEALAAMETVAQEQVSAMLQPLHDLLQRVAEPAWSGPDPAAIAEVVASALAPQFGSLQQTIADHRPPSAEEISSASVAAMTEPMREIMATVVESIEAIGRRADAERSLLVDGLAGIREELQALRAPATPPHAEDAMATAAAVDNEVTEDQPTEYAAIPASAEIPATEAVADLDQPPAAVTDLQVEEGDADHCGSPENDAELTVGIAATEADESNADDDLAAESESEASSEESSADDDLAVAAEAETETSSDENIADDDLTATAVPSDDADSSRDEHLDEIDALFAEAEQALADDSAAHQAILAAEAEAEAAATAASHDEDSGLAADGTETVIEDAIDMDCMDTVAELDQGDEGAEPRSLVHLSEDHSAAAVLAEIHGESDAQVTDDDGTGGEETQDLVAIDDGAEELVTVVSDDDSGDASDASSHYPVQEMDALASTPSTSDGDSPSHDAASVSSMSAAIADADADAEDGDQEASVADDGEQGDADQSSQRAAAADFLALQDQLDAEVGASEETRMTRLIGTARQVLAERAQALEAAPESGSLTRSIRDLDDELNALLEELSAAKSESAAMQEEMAAFGNGGSPAPATGALEATVAAGDNADALTDREEIATPASGSVAMHQVSLPAAAAAAQMSNEQLQALLSEQLIQVLDQPEVRQKLFAVFAMEAAVNPSALGELTGIRAFLRRELERVVSEQESGIL